LGSIAWISTPRCVDGWPSSCSLGCSAALIHSGRHASIGRSLLFGPARRTVASVHFAQTKVLHAACSDSVCLGGSGRSNDGWDTAVWHTSSTDVARFRARCNCCYGADCLDLCCRDSALTHSCVRGPWLLRS